MTTPDPTAGTALGRQEPMTPVPDGVPPELWLVFEDEGLDGDGSNDPPRAARAVAALLSAAREAGREEGRAEERERIADRLMEARWLADAFAPWAQAAKIARNCR